MATAHHHADQAEQALAIADAPGLPTQCVDRLIAVAQVHVELAKVRLELERRSAENAATDRLLADDLLPDRLGNLDDYCMCPIVIGLAKHEADCPHYKPTNDEGSAASSAEPIA